MPLKILRLLLAYLGAIILSTTSNTDRGVADALAMMPSLPGAALHCARCNGLVAPDDVYLEAMNQIWHPGCLTCAACDAPFPDGSFVLDERSRAPVCSHCFINNNAERCQVCTKPMIGTCFETFYWGGKYCAEHEDQMEKCYCCGRPVCDTMTGGGVRYEDGRIVCNICMTEANIVDDEQEAKSILYSVWSDLVGMGFDFGDMKDIPPLRLVDAETTGGVDGTSILSTRKFFGHEVGRSTEILVLHGLPRTHLASVIAHELGHVYIHRWQYPDLPEQVEEGLCELMACTWLTSQAGDPYAEYHYQLKVHNEDPVYGEGLRAALSAVRGNHEYSVELFEFVRENGHIP